MNNISAIIVANANPIHIFETIDSIEKIVNEIVIVDIGIDPDVITKLKKHNIVTIRPIKEPIQYVELIRETSKEFAKNEHIIFLDPDEVVTKDLAKMITDNYDKYDYISIPRKNIIMQKWIQHSRWWPDYQTRVFKKESVMWPKKLHAQPELTGNGLTLDAKEELAIVHYNYENLTEYFQKMVRYADSEASELIQKKESYTLSKTIQNALQEFISRYFADKGYKDGTHGFVLSFLQMTYAFFVYFFYWEKKKYSNEQAEQIPKEIQHFFKQGLFETNYWLEKTGKMKSSFKDKLVNKLLRQ